MLHDQLKLSLMYAPASHTDLWLVLNIAVLRASCGLALIAGMVQVSGSCDQMQESMPG